jgi:hypothetical protein
MGCAPQNIYNRLVRRLIAIAIAILIGLPSVSPLFALGSGDDPSRPACCRRGGKHHCMMMDMDAGASSSGAVLLGTQPAGIRLTAATVSERCPYGSQSVPGGLHPDWSLRTSAAIFAGVVAHPAVAAQTESKRRISADRSRQKRGPPPQDC